MRAGQGYKKSERVKGRGIFAALGAVSGLGNAFRFPALCARYGAVFIVAYGISLVLIGYPVLCAELSVASRTIKTGGKRAKIWRGIMCAAAVNSAFIALYYAVIAAKVCGAGLSAAINLPADGPTLSVFSLAAVLVAAAFILRRGGKGMAVSGALSVLLMLSVFGFLAICGLKSGGIEIFLSLRLSGLMQGAIWADALGQSVLALSLASGIMPAFAKGFCPGFSPAREGGKIVFVNFLGCMVSMLATLPFYKNFEGEGIAVALTLFPQIICALFASGFARKVLSVCLYFALTAIAVHSMCSLITPLLSFLPQKIRFKPLLYCLLCALLAPVFCAFDGQVYCAVDRMACSVTGVIIVLSECLFFASRRHISGSIAQKVEKPVHIFCAMVCGTLALFSLCFARFNCFCAAANAFAFFTVISSLAGGIYACLKSK